MGSEKSTQYELGLVLSGGGARGFGHFGFAQALYERGIKPNIIAGSSAGALVGAFLADGWEPEKAFTVLKQNGLLKYTKMHWPKEGLLSLDGLREELARHLSVDKVESLRLPMFIAASNLHTGQVEYSNKGPLIDWLVASSSIPVLFPPVKIGKHFYADGGLLDNLPAKPIADNCKHLIGVNVSPIDSDEDLSNLIRIAVRSFHLSVDVTAERGRKLCDIYVEPKGIGKLDLLDMKGVDKAYKLGYEAGKQLEFPQLS